MNGDHDEDATTATGGRAPSTLDQSLEPPARRRRPWSALAVCAAVVTVLASIVALSWRAPDADAEAGEVDVETARAMVGDLVEHARQTGDLGFGPTRELGGGPPGTITSVAPIGSTVGRGQELYRVDDQPVILLIGTLPAWREFTPGMTDGADVLQLEQNLQALGFLDEAPDTVFGWDTGSGIEGWQEALGLEETGTVELGRVVFSPGDVRVAEHRSPVGAASGGAALGVTATEKVVTVDIHPSLAGFAPPGGVVEVSLPDGTTTGATITAAGAPVERDDGQGGTSLEVPLTLVLDDPAAAGSLSDVQVTVTIEHVLAEDVLLVPVLALLARPGGGFAVERVTPEGDELVDVELGAIADGLAEVSSAGLADGDEVVVGS